jgi:Uma2 family endonuclease
MASIPEYWLVDPVDRTVTVFTLEEAEDRYATRGIYRSGDAATSASLPGFGVDVQQLFDRDD